MRMVVEILQKHEEFNVGARVNFPQKVASQLIKEGKAKEVKAIPVEKKK